MRVERWIPWIMLAIWASWIAGLQALLVAEGWLGPWVPDLGVLFPLALCCQLHKRDVPLAVLLIALSRIAHTIEPPTAILAGFLGLSLAVAPLRGLAEIERPGLRALVGGCATLCFALWMSLVHVLRVGGELSWTRFTDASLEALPAVLITALAALPLFGGLVRLPGLSPLRRRSELW